jgi:hypothetical protein
MPSKELDGVNDTLQQTAGKYKIQAFSKEDMGEI